MLKKAHRRLVLCGGGSGGHLTPSLSVADAFLKKVPDAEVLFLISKLPLDEMILKTSSFSYKKISTGKLRRYFSWENFFDFFRFIAGFFQSLFILYTFRADIVFSKGGFVALPVALAAKVLNISVIAHESDTVSGLANRIISKFARKVCHGFPLKNLSAKHVFTGTPIRKEIFEADAVIGKKFLDFPDEKPLVLFMGASQGAEQINNICEAVLPELLKKAQVVLVAGKGKLLSFVSDGFRQFEFLGKEFPHVLAACDVVVSRSGANSLFEIAALKKASILVPLDSSAGDHQRSNAKIFKEAGASFVFDPLEKELEKKVLEKIVFLLENPLEKKKLETASEKLAIIHAAEEIVKVILE